MDIRESSNLPYTDRLDVSFNEYSYRSVAQRILDRLYENDAFLEKIFTDIFGQFAIRKYDPRQEYKYNQIVWFYNRQTGAGLKFFYVLRCDRNIVDPGSLSNWPSKSFQSCGWADLNPDIDILTDYGIGKRIDQYIQRMFRNHSSDLTMHPYGRVTYLPGKSSSLDRKLAKRDLQNLNPNREQVFFPFQTFRLNTRDSILDGIGRRYDNGMLEYDLVFRLSYSGRRVVDKDYGTEADILICNNLRFDDDHGSDMYFNTESDKQIFAPSVKNTFESEIGDTRQRSRNDYVNVYSADIDFTQGGSFPNFSDTNYMVFCSDVLSQSRDTKSGSVNFTPNHIVFTKKTATSITAVLITYSNQASYQKSGYNAENGGLQSNSFHCHIIGKCVSK